MRKKKRDWTNEVRDCIHLAMKVNKKKAVEWYKNETADMYRYKLIKINAFDVCDYEKIKQIRFNKDTIVIKAVHNSEHEDVFDIIIIDTDLFLKEFYIKRA